MYEVESFSWIEVERDPYGRIVSLTGLEGDVSQASGWWKWCCPRLLDAITVAR